MYTVRMGEDVLQLEPIDPSIPPWGETPEEGWEYFEIPYADYTQHIFVDGEFLDVLFLNYEKFGLDRNFWREPALIYGKGWRLLVRGQQVKAFHDWWMGKEEESVQ